MIKVSSFPRPKNNKQKKKKCFQIFLFSFQKLIFAVWLFIVVVFL